METKALLYFRQTPNALKAKLPQELQFLARALREIGPGRARANLTLSPSQLSALLEWGRTRVAGATLLRIARLDQRFQRSELGEGSVELFRDLQHEPPQVLNAPAAFEARWSCTHCERVEMSQTGLLEVTGMNLDSDVQLTESYEVLLSSRFGAVAERAGAPVKPLQGRGDFLQLAAPPTVALVPVFPLFAVGPVCPGCGRISYDRSDHLEGDLLVDDEAGLIVAQEWPLTVVLGSDTVGRSRERIGWRGSIAAQAEHVVGEPLDMVTDTAWVSGATAVVVRLALVDALLRAGAGLPPLRPLRIAT